MTRRDRTPLVSGDEYDALTRWRRFLRWKPGERKTIKRKYNRRVRQLARKLFGRRIDS